MFSWKTALKVILTRDNFHILNCCFVFIGTGSCFATLASFEFVLHFTILSYGDRVEGVTKLCGILFSRLGVFKLSWSMRRKVDFVSSLFVVGLVEESGED